MRAYAIFHTYLCKPQGMGIEMFIGGIDIGGTKTIVAVADQNGDLLCTNQFPTDCQNMNRHFDGCAEKLQECAESQGIALRQLEGVGITAPGMVDEQGTLLWAPFAKWKQIPLAQEFSRRLGIGNIHCDCDVNACALAEAYFGGYRNLLWITVSTGIGGGIIINGEVYRGANAIAGEIGHMKVEYDSPSLCSCGQYGCAEAHASGTAMQKLIMAAIEKNPQYRALYEKNNLEMNGAGCASLARNGDPFSIAIYQQIGDYLGRVIANAANLMNPETIFIGGGMSRDLDVLMPFIRERMAKSAVIFLKDTPILQTKLGYHAAIKGAVTLILKSNTNSNKK